MASVALHDSAFEPHSGFMFEEPTVDDEFSNMQHNIASLNVLTSAGQAYHSSLDRVHDNGMNSTVDISEHIDSFMFDHDDISPHSPSWAGAQAGGQTQSTQAGIADQRSGTVYQQFGQITPPHDATIKEYAGAASGPPPPSQTTPPVQTSSSAKSDRARNAANQRHAKAKRARRDSGRGADSPEDQNEEVEDKRERYREKNRLAAAKCRAKKKVNTGDLEESARIITAQNNKLRAEERELRDLFSSLRDQALAHDATQGCPCRAIHSYNMHKAQQTAREAVGMHGFLIPSPPQRNTDSASPHTFDPSSRSQSFSETRPQFASYTGQSQSLASTVPYAPSTTADETSRRTSCALSNAGNSNHAFPHSPASRSIQGDEAGFAEYTHRSPDGQQVNYG